MTNINKNFLDSITENDLPASNKNINQDKKNRISSRKETFSEQANTVLTKQLLVDPARCRMWSGHNRRYELLNEHRCQDLIEGFRSQGRQEIPAIVRKITDDDYDYEVICGARRHWTATYMRKKWPDFKFLIEPRQLTDEEAFRLSDIENRDRDDICDYERAIDYKKALHEYYNDRQVEMVKNLECDAAWLSRLLKLADLPQPIIDAYRDVTEITVEHYKKLARFLTDPAAKKRIITQAERLKTKELKPALLVNELVKAGNGSVKNTVKTIAIQIEGGKKVIHWSKKGGGYALTIAKNCSRDEIKEAIEKFLKIVD